MSEAIVEGIGRFDDRTNAVIDRVEEARAFWRLRRRLTVNHVRLVLRESRLRLILVVSLSVLFWAALFWLFRDGFQFLADALPHPSTRVHAIGAIFNVFFLSLLVMLVFSTGIISYSGLFRTQETEFLLTLPASAARVFSHKLQEAMLFSSWGFLLLGSPMLVAYGLIGAAPWYYYAMLVPYMIAFIQIPCALGAIGCLVLVRWLPAHKTHALLMLSAALLAVGIMCVASIVSNPAGALMTPQWFHELLGRLQFSEQRLLPGWWLTTGLFAAAEGQAAESVLFLALLISNALFFHLLATWTASSLLWSAFHGSRAVRTRPLGLGIGLIDRCVGLATCLLPKPMRLLIANDLRLFRRDPVQWTQFLIFFGLLGLYFANIRRLSYDLSQATWVNMVSFLNLTVVGLILSTFTSRFVFPMISLEGRRFWILARLPIRRRTILWSKFLFASAGSVVPCVSLVLLSDLMLRVMPAILLLHAITCIMLCLGLAALAVGMGAKMPNLREDSPSKIAAGFGGTLNLVISTIYIVAIVLLTALPCHFYLGALQADPREIVFDQAMLRYWILLGTAASAVLCLLTTALPLWLGIRAFDRLEV